MIQTNDMKTFREPLSYNFIINIKKNFNVTIFWDVMPSTNFYQILPPYISKDGTAHSPRFENLRYSTNALAATAP
jgi:hypothetical protein